MKGDFFYEEKQMVCAGMALVMTSALLMGCGSKNETPQAGGAETEAPKATEEEKISCELLVWSPAEDQAKDQGACFRQCVRISARNIRIGISHLSTALQRGRDCQDDCSGP